MIVNDAMTRASIRSPTETGSWEDPKASKQDSDFVFHIFFQSDLMRETKYIDPKAE